MATKKDLVEAQSFSKRRLTTAFVSGAPGGREVEPDRPLRAVVGGVALTVVLVLGSMAFGWLRSALPDDWKNDRLVIAEDSGARYVSIQSTLHPVVNTTSARLLIPADRFTVVAVPDDELADIRRGPTLGIQGAPDSLAPSDRLVNTGWVSCLGAGEQVTTVIGSQRRAGSADGSAVLARSSDRTFVLDGGMRYPVADRDVSAVSVALRLDGRPPIAAPAAWLNLFPQGPALGPLTVDDLGKPLPGLPAGSTVGSVLRLDSDGRHYVVTPQGTLELLPDVALAMYRLGSGASAKEVPVQAAQIARLTVQQPRLAPSDWPRDLPTGLETTPCATLTAATGSPPEVRLTTVTEDPPTAERGRTTVDTGDGALVRAVSGQVLGKGPVLAVDQTGTAYAVDGVDQEVLARLGYTPEDVVPVPQAWTELFRSGPSLGVEAARTVVSGTS
ncbi:type VII secretion protein EccB [Phycicoccus sp. CSK15P-2]|uniref:type VII secretion protein EccB n=1 Tax=Phycicoccus sp. CSK15P-2 TaxID=2807627 RepID=UPI00194F56B4|nr:type VII secretion protein EccB [Phycicoccus sp. CSK15P-2]MBM6404234.1 type VII secretion protein EccB [Phycicoccus sp. CSK15P-2]